MKRRDLKLQPIDLFTVAIKDYARLQIGFTLRTAKKLDTERFKAAIDKSLLSVPLFGCGFNPDKLRFVEAGYRADDMVFVHREPYSEECEPHLDSEPQLMNIHIYDNGEGQIIKFCLDHILVDGRGFMEYLLLLCNIYNDPASNVIVKNYRDMYRITSRFSGIRKTKETRGVLQTLEDVNSIPRPTGHIPYIEGGTPVPNVSTIELSEELVGKIKNRGKTIGATLNDVFLAAWFHTIFAMSDKDKSRIDIPVDMRPFFGKYLEGKTTITNFSSVYVIYADRADATSLDSLVLSVNKTMKERKESSAFLGVMKLLYTLSRFVPLKSLEKLLAKNAGILPEFFSNLGVLDHRNLVFGDNEVMGLYATSSFFPVPYLQVLVCTFRGTTTLAMNRSCSPENKQISEKILETMKRILLEWVEMNFAG